MKKLIFFTILTSSFSFAQNAELKGVITYFFNDNFGFKPDVGATIYIIEGDEENEAYNSIKDFQRQKKLTSAYLDVLSSDKKLKNKEKKQKKEEANKILEEKTNAALSSIFQIEISKSYKELLMADGDGNFSAILPEGDYIVIAISKNRNDLNVAEIKGKIDCRHIVISNEKTVYNVNFEFDL